MTGKISPIFRGKTPNTPAKIPEEQKQPPNQVLAGKVLPPKRKPTSTPFPSPLAGKIIPPKYPVIYPFISSGVVAPPTRRQPRPPKFPLAGLVMPPQTPKTPLVTPPLSGLVAAPAPQPLIEETKNTKNNSDKVKN